MLGEFWDVPPPKAAEKPGPVQTTMPMWSRVLGGRSQTKSSSAGARAEGRQPPRIAGQIPASPAAGCQLIDSSDSSAEIECIATPPPRQQRTRQKPRSSAQTQNTGAKERADATSASQSGNTAAAARFSAKPCAAEEVVLDEEDDVVEVTADRGEKGAKDDAEVVLVLHPRRAPNRNRVLETPRHTRKRRAEELFAPSSPLLLHASSPTIKRFNTQQSQAVVLVEATQGLAGDELLPSSPPAAADHFSGDTLVSSSACPPQQSGDNSVSVQTAADGCDSSLMAAIDSTEWVPETPRQLLPADPPLTLGLGLSSDPISDFCSPAASPSLELNPAYERFGDRCLLSTLGSDPIPKGAGSETAPFAHSEAGHGAETDTGADADACTNPSITQWYHSNLQRCQSDDYDDDDDASGGLELPFDNSYGDLSLEGDSEGESAACETESSANAAQQQTEDGYSSPLEGFWDLRAATQGSSNERDMYYNQFQPTARQLANRQRAAERRTTCIQPSSSSACTGSG
ncbi:hypothetical protein GQ54DRAFT_305515 [Martensiomyces pterosporus]|nr:hypothetical protein GQ54DRAFT_305515 [Martensiomyces pterosporus]